MLNGAPSLKMNLQLFADEDYSGFLSPEDIQGLEQNDIQFIQDQQESQESQEPAQPQAGESQEQKPDGSVEDITPTETQAEKKEEPQKIKVKFLHEEREIPLEEAVPLIQKGLNYDRLQEKLKKLESDPRLAFVDELAKQSGYEDVNQYMEAVRNWQEKQKLDELIQKNIPEDLAREIMENRKFRAQIEAERKARAEEEKRRAEYIEFLEAYPDVKPEQIKPETWELVSKGVPLKYAYMQQENEELKNQIKILKQNEENVKRAVTGSVTEHGSGEPTAEDPFIKGFDSV